MNYRDLIVIGAGMSGLTLANEMKRSGQSVIVLEKARGSGGRLSSKRTALKGSGGHFTFDLGCPSFTAKSEAFKAFLNDESARLETLQEGRETRYFAKPRNSMLTRQMAEHLDVNFSSKVKDIKHDGQTWTVTCESSEGALHVWTSARLVISAPPEQTAALLPANHHAQGLLSQAFIDPQWVVAFALNEASPSRAALQRLAQHPDVFKISIENDKAGRDYAPGLAVCVIHFTPAWTKQTLDWEKDAVRSHALTCLSSVFTDEPDLSAVHVHRWLYSLPTTQAFADEHRLAYFLDESGLGLCGDYLASTNYEGVERAWLSAMALASGLKERIAAEPQLAEASADGI